MFCNQILIKFCGDSESSRGHNTCRHFRSTKLIQEAFIPLTVKRPRAPAHLPGDEVLELLDLLLVLRVLLHVLVIKEGLEDRQTDRAEQSELVGREKISDFFRHASESCSPPSSGAVGKKVM